MEEVQKTSATFFTSATFYLGSIRKFWGQKIVQLAISGTQSHENPFSHMVALAILWLRALLFVESIPSI